MHSDDDALCQTLLALATEYQEHPAAFAVARIRSLRARVAELEGALRQVVRIADIDENYETEGTNPYEAVARRALTPGTKEGE